MEHLLAIVNEFENGHTCEQSNLERSISIKIKTKILKEFKLEIDDERRES